MTDARRRTDSRVSTLELFLDLVFVFTIEQIGAAFEEDLSFGGLGRALLVFGVLWWMYGGYVWLTNQIRIDGARERLLLLGGMAGFLVAGIAIPHAFDGAGVVFGLGYLLVLAVHSGLFALGGWRRNLRRLAPLNLLSGILVLVAGLVGTGWVVTALWLAALGVQVVIPRLGAVSADLDAAHFVERHGGLVMIALGETVIAIGASVDPAHVEPGAIGVVLLAFVLAAGLYWSYFTNDPARAERVLGGLDRGRRDAVAIRAYFFAHIPLILGIVLATAGLHAVVAHPDEPLPAGEALSLGGGIAIYFAGDAAFRCALGMEQALPRLVGAVAVLLTALLGTAAPAWIQLAAMTSIVLVLLLVERRLPRTRMRPATAFEVRSSRPGRQPRSD